MPRILLTGVCTLDIINQLSHYPTEDSEVRASSQSIRTGGNACNTAIVIQQLGIQASLLARLADDNSANFIREELEKYQVSTSLCPVQNNSTTPTSYISLNQNNGSRTIVHYRDLNELDATDFTSIELSHFDWLHFEARDCTQLHAMLQHSKAFNIPVSIEIEKPRDAIDSIMPFANILLISKPFAESRGFTRATACLEYFSALYPDKTITCTWGAQGAWVYHDSQLMHQAATNLSETVETIGAGDTFNAGFIASQINQLSVQDSLKHACLLAGKKCQQSGYDNLTITI